MTCKAFNKKAAELAALRAENAKLQADARLGRMVRGVREHIRLTFCPESSICCFGVRLEVEDCHGYLESRGFYDTPEEALIAAGCGETEGEGK